MGFGKFEVVVDLFIDIGRYVVEVGVNSNQVYIVFYGFQNSFFYVIFFCQ